MTEPTIIPRKDYYAIIGLLEVAKRHNKALKEIEQAIAAIAGVEGDAGYYGHISDMVYDAEPDADTLLRRLTAVVPEDDRP